MGSVTKLVSRNMFNLVNGRQGHDGGSGGDSSGNAANIMNSSDILTPLSYLMENKSSTICGNNEIPDTSVYTPRRNARRSCNLNAVRSKSDVEDIVFSDPGKRKEASLELPLKFVNCVENAESTIVQLSQGVHENKNNRTYNNSAKKQGESVKTDFANIVVNDSPSTNFDDKSDRVSCKSNEIEVHSTPKTSRRNRVKLSRASLSSQKSVKKKAAEEYDPDNDIFLHGDMHSPYNLQKLRKEIGEFLSTSDIATYSTESPEKNPFGGESEKSFNESVQSVGSSSSRSPKKSSAKSVRSKGIRQMSLFPDLSKLCQTPVSPVNNESTASRLQNLLVTHETLRQIKQRQNSFNFLTSHSYCEKSERAIKEDCVTPTQDLAATPQFSKLMLKDVVAYVDVIFENEERSSCVQEQLIQLGATVVNTFTRLTPVTHIIFNEGHLSTYVKAKKRNIPLVSILWIEECKKTGLKVPEEKFAANTEEYESPRHLKKKLKRRRIIKESPKQQRWKSKSTECTPSTEKYPAESAKGKSACVPRWVKEAVGNDGALNFLVQVTGIKEQEFNNLVNSDEVTDDSETVTPLAVRLLKKFALDKKAQRPAEMVVAGNSTGSCKNSESELDQQNDSKVISALVSDGDLQEVSQESSFPSQNRSVQSCKRKLVSYESINLENSSVPSDAENPHKSPPHKRMRRASTQNVNSLWRERVAGTLKQHISKEKKVHNELLRPSQQWSVNLIQQPITCWLQTRGTKRH